MDKEKEQKIFAFLFYFTSIKYIKIIRNELLLYEAQMTLIMHTITIF